MKKLKRFKDLQPPDYQKNATLIPLTESDANGNFKYFNFSYTNPYDSIIRPVNAVFNAYANGTLNDKTADQIVFDALFYDKLNRYTRCFNRIFYSICIRIYWMLKQCLTSHLEMVKLEMVELFILKRYCIRKNR